MTPKQAPAPGAPGAETPTAAVTAFLDASRAGDLQALSAIWGTSTGPIRNDVPEPELSKREFYLVSCTKHDKFKILNDVAGQAGRRLLAVEITRGALTRSTTFTAVAGPQSRWYVEKLDLSPNLDAICQAK